MSRSTWLKGFCFLSVFAMVPLVSLFAQYQPPPGTQSVSSYLSPTFLAGGASITSQESPEADVLNPAVAATKQRVTLDASYIGLIGTNANEGWLGHIANIGNTIPSKFGVFSWSAHFLSSALPEVALGTYGGLDLSFAKDLYPNLLVGLGLTSSVGTNGGSDWGLAGTVGFLALAGDVGFLKDFKWGVAVQNMGKGFKPVYGLSAYPAPFTPVVGASFDLLKGSQFQIGFSGDLGFPSFQDVTLRVGGRISYRDSLSLTFSSGVDLQELLNPGIQPRGFIPSVGLSYTFKTGLGNKSQFLKEHGWNTTELKTQTSVAPMQGGVWALGLGANAPLGVIDHTPPKIIVDYPHPLYISPNNDGRQDALELPISITDQRYVRGYKLDFYNASGRAVREIKNKEERPENQGIQSIVSRLLAVKSGIPVPPSLRWDGLGNDGRLVPDGTYTFALQAWDDNGNTATTQRYTVYVDTTPPSVEITQPTAVGLIFSPNGDGNKDTLKIEQTGTKEILWTGRIASASGRTVRTFQWKDSKPLSFVWDGKESDGKVAPDGVYKYELSATDRAGNMGGGSLDNIIINTQATPVTLSIGSQYFSPNGDGVKDTELIKPNVPVAQGISSWTLLIKNVNGETVRSYSGGASAPAPLYFDGRSTRGSALPEGAYSAQLSIQYVNGNNPHANSPLFTIDVTAPQASVTKNYEVFSPNGDGNKDTITFYQDTSKQDLWTGAVYNAQGSKVKSYSWVGTADSKVVWDGHADDGLLVPDGTYTYRIESTDRAGNVGRSNTVSFEVNTEKTPVFLSVEYEAFSPNSDGVKDTQKIYPQIRVSEGIESYHLSIRSAHGTTVRTFSGRGTPPTAFTWEGLDDQGNRVPDGNYNAVLGLTYSNGNAPVAPSPKFVVDTKYPQISATVNRTLFSPNGDGHKDTATFTNTSSNETLWEADIRDSKGNVVRREFWKGQAGSFVWDGTDAQGNTVPDGAYSYTVFSTDAAGNSSRAVIRNIVVDTRPTPIFVTAGAEGFSPNGDGVDDTISFGTVVSQTAGISSWQMDLVSSGGAVVRSYTGGSTVPSSITWDGKTSSGALAPEGSYHAQFRVVYEKGNQPTATTSAFVLDVSGPHLSVTISPLPFSPDNDGVNDELTFATAVADQSQIGAWKLEIFDPKSHPFKDFSGSGTPSHQIIWDGKSDTGELVASAEDYPYTMRMSDIYGNSTTVSGTIPVDILVIKEGNKLRIRISSIIFAPDSASLQTSDPGQNRKNEKVLDRLAEIFKKYDTYNIRIEGYAVSVYWNNPVKAKEEQQQVLIPLSLSRANAVRDALVKRGLNAARISTVGLGANDPVVPNSDLQDRWKNRRVEFILIK